MDYRVGFLYKSPTVYDFNWTLHTEISETLCTDMFSVCSPYKVFDWAKNLCQENRSDRDNNAWIEVDHEFFVERLYLLTCQSPPRRWDGWPSDLDKPHFILGSKVQFSLCLLKGSYYRWLWTLDTPQLTSHQLNNITMMTCGDQAWSQPIKSQVKGNLMLTVDWGFVPHDHTKLKFCLFY